MPGRGAVSEGARRLSTKSRILGLQRHHYPISRQVKNALSRWFANLLGFRCRLCGAASGQQALCHNCLIGLPWLGRACDLCALPVSVTGICGSCQRSAPAWDAAMVALNYEFPADHLVTAFKFNRDLAAGAALAQAMVQGHWPQVERGHAPWLVPVPLHWTRSTVRGFNQALELAVQLSDATGWPLHTGLRRRRRTAPQSGLTARERRSNLHDAFRWKGPPLAHVTIVLVDDVVTTGTTVAACARALNGAERVIIWAACRATQ